MTFDEPGAKISGVPTGWLELIFNVMIALTVVASIKIVGSLLISALLIIPAASAMQLSSSFRGTVLISMFLGITTVLAGLFASVAWDVATGGIVVLISVAVFAGCVVVKRFLKPDQPAMSRGLPR